MSLDLSKLEKVRERNGKRIARCPVCALSKADEKAEHLFIGADGGYRCIVDCDPKAIFALVGNRDGLQLSGPAPVIRPRPARKPVDLLSRIKAEFPACVANFADSSPVFCDWHEDEARAFLRLFPADAIVWIAPDIFQSGKPEHAVYFRARAEWERETLAAPGTRIAPCSFKSGAYGRSRENVAEHLFVVVESDEIGEGKLYADKDEFCSLIRWLREGRGWHLAAVVDSGNRSLHAWFQHPGLIDMEHLGKHAAALGLDKKFTEASQPWRLPGVVRENATTRQQLVYLDLKGTP